MKKLLVLALLLGVQAQGAETWKVAGKTFENKAAAIRFIIAHPKSGMVEHSRCELLTNKLTFKACPKNKGSNFDSMPYGEGRDS